MSAYLRMEAYSQLYTRHKHITYESYLYYYFEIRYLEQYITYRLLLCSSSLKISSINSQ